VQDLGEEGEARDEGEQAQADGQRGHCGEETVAAAPSLIGLPVRQLAGGGAAPQREGARLTLQPLVSVRTKEKLSCLIFHFLPAFLDRNEARSGKQNSQMERRLMLSKAEGNR